MPLRDGAEVAGEAWQSRSKARGGGESGRQLLLGNYILQPRLEVPVKILSGLLLNQFLQI